MNKQEVIIQSKLNQPFIRDRLVPRPALEERLTAGVRGPLTLVTAPAGFGKTTLVVSCLKTWGLPTGWLSLDKADNQIRRFLTYLIAAFQTIDPELGQEAVRLLSAPMQPQTEALLTGLINDLQRYALNCVLVLDDYHLIQNGDVHDVMRFFLEFIPSNLHLVLLSRSDPPLPLARLRARGQLTELRAADLRFLPSESSLFLNEIMGLEIDVLSAATLQERTEGWAAGLQMAALSIREQTDKAAFIQRFSGTHRYIFDYLMGDVLNHQPQEIQQFLLVTSILERLTGPLCDHLLSLDDLHQNRTTVSSAAVLVSLERDNLFLIPLDEENRWYRYHQLFSDLLNLRLTQHYSADVISRLQERAAEWYAQQGYIVDAVHHLVAAKLYFQAAVLIEQHGPRFWQDNDPSVMQMAEFLPKETLYLFPKLALYQLWLLIMQGRIKEVFALLTDLSTFPDQDQMPWMKTILHLVEIFLYPPGTGPQEDLLVKVEALQEIPVSEPILRNAADYLFVMSLGRRGALKQAAAVAADCVERERTSTRLKSSLSLIPFLTRLTLMMGQLKTAGNLCRDVLSSVSGDGGDIVDLTGSIKIDLGEILYEWGRLDEAEVLIREGLLANQPWQNIMTEGFGLTVLTRVLMARLDFAAAARVLDQFEERMAASNRPKEFEEDFYTLRIVYQIQSGEKDKVVRWFEDPANSHIVSRYPFISAQVLLLQGRYAEAEALLKDMSSGVVHGSRVARTIAMGLLRAVSAQGLGRQAESNHLIKTCLSLAEPEGYLQVFLVHASTVPDLLETYLRSGDAPQTDFARKVLAVYKNRPAIPAVSIGAADLVEPLSERELEILSIMARGKTNKDIARELIIASGTVKAHAASIYRKLDVNNRTEAVDRARQLGILS